MKRCAIAIFLAIMMVLCLAETALGGTPLHDMWKLPEDVPFETFLDTFEAKTGVALTQIPEDKPYVSYSTGIDDANQFELFGYPAKISLLYNKDTDRITMDIRLETYSNDASTVQEILTSLHQCFESLVRQISEIRGVPDDASLEFFSLVMPDDTMGGGTANLPLLDNGSFDYELLERVYQAIAPYDYGIYCQWGLDKNGSEVCSLSGNLEFLHLGDSNNYVSSVSVRYDNQRPLWEEDLEEIAFYKNLRQPIEDFIGE